LLPKMRSNRPVGAIAVLLFLLGLGTPRAKCQTTINFGGLPDGTLVTSQYQNLGVIFLSSEAGGPQARITGGAIPGPDYLCPGPTGASDQFNGSITLTFSSPVVAFSSSIADGPTTLTGYAANGQTQTVSYGGGSPHAALNLNPSFVITQAVFTGTFYCVDFVSFTGGFAIIMPTDNAKFSLTDSTYTATSPITFQAGPIAASATVQWTAQLNYATSGGRGSFQDLRNFTTDSTTTTHNETYTSIGGKVTIQAKENGSNPQSAPPITIYVVGIGIPDADITMRLVNLYGGATPNLMTGIAVRESSYRQFITRSLFSVSALWPTESPDGGSHIGLMQMPTTQADAWDWTANTADGTHFFLSAKVPLAQHLTSLIIKGHPGLRQLTAVELEHVAVCLYGAGALPKLSQQYYAPVKTASGGWDWAVNSSGNPQGVAYTNYVFGHLR